jgi:hypothetical protein
VALFEATRLHKSTPKYFDFISRISKMDVIPDTGTFSIVAGFERAEELLSVMGNGCDFVVCCTREIVTHFETQSASVQIHTPKFRGSSSQWRAREGGQCIVDEPLGRTKWDATAPVLDKSDVARLFAGYKTVWLLRGGGGRWLRGWDAAMPGEWRDGAQRWQELAVVGATGPRARGDGWLHDAGTDACEAQSAVGLPLLDLSEVLELGTGIGAVTGESALVATTGPRSSNWLLVAAGRRWFSWRNEPTLSTAQSVARVEFPLSLVQQLAGLLGWAYCGGCSGGALVCRVGWRGPGLVRVTTDLGAVRPCAGGAVPRAIDMLLAI